MTTTNSSFSLEAFKDNPLVAIDHEGDLSKIRNNSVLTSVVSHDRIVINVKYQHPFSLRLNTTLFIATNKPVMITERASGIIRRLVDIRPTGLIVSIRDYESLVNQIDFELGAIAYKCLELYSQLGKDHYNRYVPLDMMYRTNIFFNFVDEYYLEFVREDKVTLTRAWSMYKQFCEETGITNRLARHTFRDELKNYWGKFHKVTRIDGVQVRSVYTGFSTGVFEKESTINKGEPVIYDWLALSEQTSVFDREHADQPAQVASKAGPPRYTWEKVTKTVSDINTSKLHYVLPKENLVTLDFDIKDDSGEKSLALNIEAARKLPPTYAETSKSGEGLHLHYYYDGAVSQLSRIYEPGIEVLKPSGNFSIRRKLSVCNDHIITTINSGLPVKSQKGTDMVSKKTISNERSLRTLILRNLQKEIHPATKPSIDFINTILEETFIQGLRYDISDLRPFILEFASKSTNNAPYCVEKALNMKYISDHDEPEEVEEPKDPRLVFYDVEVFPNFLLVCWKYEGSDNVVRMIDPMPSDIETLMETKLVGFNNRRYDNHILFGRFLGFSTEQIYQLSKRIISGDRDAFFREAYGISHTDVYDYSTIKKSLKAWQIDLGIFHSEL
ncbi:MAG: primase-like DNA-binding domain-containing protein, partial [Candidatus Dadabacteria bacterium]